MYRECQVHLRRQHRVKRAGEYGKSFRLLDKRCGAIFQSRVSAPPLMSSIAAVGIARWAHTLCDAMASAVLVFCTRVRSYAPSTLNSLSPKDEDQLFRMVFGVSRTRIKKVST